MSPQIDRLVARYRNERVFNLLAAGIDKGVRDGIFTLQDVREVVELLSWDHAARPPAIQLPRAEGRE